MRPGPGQLVHFSEDPGIRRFVPHVAATSTQPEPYVWAVDAARSPDYWFPRACPRALAWVASGTTDADRDRIIGAGCGQRVHVIEHGWLEALRTVRLYAYRLPADRFQPVGEPEPHAHVAAEPVEPLGPPSRSATCSACTPRQASSCGCWATCGRPGTRWSPVRSDSAVSGCATPGPAHSARRGDGMLVAFSVSPVGTGEAVGAAVAEAVRVVRASGLPNRTDAMFTTIEGEWDEVMAVVKAATDAVAAAAPRVSLVLKADIRPGFTDMLTAKIASVERLLEA
jgi:uncharacterized protein (TIGR00106 family)